MSVSLKSPREIAIMRQSGAIVGEVLAMLRDAAVPGVTTADLDERARELIEARGGRPSFLGYDGFPGSICASINEEILHGIPAEIRLRNGDVLSVDVGVELHGYHTDAAATFVVGTGSDIARELIAATEEAFRAGARQARAGNRIGDIGAAIAGVAAQAGFHVIEQYAGHGVGTELHEEPDVPNEGEAGTGIKLRSGMTLAIEPMLTVGSGATDMMDDDWTVVTEDDAIAAHYEHTVLVTDGAPEILTAPRQDVL